jgi:hypothetical protein
MFFLALASERLGLGWVTPHDESPFQENARRALNFKVSPLKFRIHNDKSLLLLLL